MADPQFERTLQRLFAEAPPAPDAPLFARRLEQRLEFGWTLRRLVIGFAALGSALLAAWQLAGTSVMGRVVDACTAPLMLVERRWHVMDAEVTLLKALPVPPDLGWLVGGLVLLAVGLAATRMVDQV
ncbi:MAG: hypothetical protein INR64_03460 [Caulobacteraceae bacterium]|nr:hypothetical protein [Caulobacter sp.]